MQRQVCGTSPLTMRSCQSSWTTTIAGVHPWTKKSPGPHSSFKITKIMIAPTEAMSIVPAMLDTEVQLDRRELLGESYHCFTSSTKATHSRPAWFVFASHYSVKYLLTWMKALARAATTSALQ